MSLARARPSLLPQATETELRRLAALIEEVSGIHLPEERWTTVFNRLDAQIVQANGVANYCAQIEAEPVSRRSLLDVLCPQETRFFREPEQLSFLSEVVFPRWRQAAEKGERQATVRAWSAASSTGEEAATLGMLLLEELGPTWKLQVLGTDFSSKALAQASSCVWNLARAEEIPSHLLRRYMLKGTGSKEGTMAAGDDLRSLLSFQRINLTTDIESIPGDFDLILCRNVLIYFRPEVKGRVATQLLRKLNRDGYLLTGHAESLRDLSADAHAVGPTTYQRKARS